MIESKPRGGHRPGAGNRKEDVSTIKLDGDMRSMLNSIVGNARILRGERVSHRQIVKELIEERWAELDQGWQGDAEREGMIL